MKKAKISLGLPYYGPLAGEWVTQMYYFIASLAQEHEIGRIISMGAMSTDINRNRITKDFLESDSEWLFWIDSDTVVPVGAVNRMLAHGKTLVSGLYYGKNEPHMPIAYFVHNGAFQPIDKEILWEKGEIIEVDSVGMGCMLTHRSVFEDIQKNFEVYQLPGGGIVPINKHNILGDIETTNGPKKHEHDGKVYQGQYRQRLIKPTLIDMTFPFFQVQYGRTEDIYFFELAAQVGHKPVLDTSVECEHLRFNGFTGADYRELKGH